jgi:16S rRNA (uracil1498-N3)-methyltransferase
MRFLFCENAGEVLLTIGGEALAHLKARRVGVGETIALRNLRDDVLYFYTIAAFDRSGAELSLSGDEKKRVAARRNVDLAWCVVEPRIIEKTLPALNEIGVRKLTLLWSEKSQRNFRLSQKRFDRILTASCEQCGRSQKMAIAVEELDVFARENPNAALLDFDGEALNAKTAHEKTIVVGPEGGFGEKDYAAFKTAARLGVATPLVLRSESAVLVAAAIALF